MHISVADYTVKNDNSTRGTLFIIKVPSSYFATHNMQKGKRANCIIKGDVLTKSTLAYDTTHCAVYMNEHG